MYLRPYEPADLDAIFKLDRVCFPPRFRFSRAIMRRVVNAEGALVLLACDTDGNTGERLLGFGAVELQHGGANPVGYLSTLDVAPESRRQGVGRLLVEQLERLVMQAGGRCMFFHVYDGNEAAVRLYDQLGYERARRIPAFYGTGYDAWLCLKLLPDATAAEEVTSAG